MNQPDSARILIVEDEVRVSSFVDQSLREAGYTTLIATTGSQAEALWKGEDIDVVILDIMLPDSDGLAILKGRRNDGDHTPVLVVSAKGSMPERITGLDAGADDYLPKPFGIEELLARIRVLVRRKRTIEPSVMTCGDLRLDLTARRVSRSGRMIFLSETEFRLITLLAQHPGEPVAKRDILAYVWDDPLRDDNVVEVYVSYLRNKLERGGSTRLIHTVRGRGYRLADEEDGS